MYHETPSQIPIYGYSFPMTPDQFRQSPIDVKFQELTRRGFTGTPVVPESTTPDRSGRFRHYANVDGVWSIYWHPATGAHEVHGVIRDKWARMGWERSLLGYPVTDESTTPDRVGRFNHFQRGSIYWHPNIGAHEVHGAIRDKWASLGWERSFLGYPVTDESTPPDGIGRFNHFQGGSIYWHPNHGAFEVHGAIRDLWASLGWERSTLGYPTSDEHGQPGVHRLQTFQGGVIHWTPQRGAYVEPYRGVYYF